MAPVTDRLRLGGVGAQRAAAAVAPREEVVIFLPPGVLILLVALDSRSRASELPRLKVRPREEVVEGLEGGDTFRVKVVQRWLESKGTLFDAARANANGRLRETTFTRGATRHGTVVLRRV